MNTNLYVGKLAAGEMMKARWNKEGEQDAICRDQGPIALRQKVVDVMNFIHPLHGFSLEALRACKEQNRDLFSFFQQTRVRLAFGLGECFNDLFTIPMLGTSLLKFGELNSKEKEKTAYIASVLANALVHDRVNPKRIAKALEDLELGIPLFIGSGYDWHITSVIILKGEEENSYYAIVANRGNQSDSGQALSGWNVYKINRVDEELIRSLACRLSHTKDQNITCEKLEKDYLAKLICQHPMKMQKKPTCSYTSIKTGIAVLFDFWEVTSGFKIKLNDVMVSQTARSFKPYQSYKVFTHFDQEDVLKDFLIDFCKITQTSQQLYQKLVNCPKLGYQVGWDLWLKFIIRYEELDPNSTPCLSPNLRMHIEGFNTNTASSKHGYLLNAWRSHRHRTEVAQVIRDINYLKSLVQQGRRFAEAEGLILQLLPFTECHNGLLQLLSCLIQYGHPSDSYLEQIKDIFSLRKRTLSKNCFILLMKTGRFEPIYFWVRSNEDLVELVEEPLSMLLTDLIKHHFDDAVKLLILLFNDTKQPRLIIRFCDQLINDGTPQKIEALIKCMDGLGKILMCNWLSSRNITFED